MFGAVQSRVPWVLNARGTSGWINVDQFNLDPQSVSLENKGQPANRFAQVSISRQTVERRVWPIKKNTLQKISKN